MVQSAFNIIKFYFDLDHSSPNFRFKYIFFIMYKYGDDMGFYLELSTCTDMEMTCMGFFPNRPPTRWLTLNCYLFLNFDSIVPYTPKQYSSCIISFQNGFFSFGGIFRETSVNVYVTFEFFFSCLAIWFRVSKRIEKEDRGKNQINSKRPIRNNIFSSRIK